MQEILQATYKNGHLILNKKLNSVLEGKTLNVMVWDTDEFEAKKERFLEFVDRQSFVLPQDYVFDREELHER